MRNTLFLLLIATLVCSVQSCKRINGAKTPGKIETKEIPISDYSYISSTLPVDIVYQQSDAPAYLKLDIDQSVIDAVVAVVKDSILHLTMKSGVTLGNIAKSTIYTNSKTLKLIASTGSSDFYLKGTVHAKRLDLRLEGSGDFVADNIQCESLALTLSGTGDASLKGQAEAAAYNLDGTGDVDASDLATKNLRVFLIGTGDAKINTSDYLYAVLKGTGDISYQQKPKQVESQVTGTGTIGLK